MACRTGRGTKLLINFTSEASLTILLNRLRNRIWVVNTPSSTVSMMKFPDAVGLALSCLMSIILAKFVYTSEAIPT